MRRLKIAVSLVLLLSLTSCNKMRFICDLDELDGLFAERGQIRTEIEGKLDSLKREAVGADSRKAVGLLYDIAQEYRFYNSDSSHKYSRILLNLAKKENDREHVSAAKIEEAFYLHYKNRHLSAVRAFEAIDTSSISKPEVWVNYYECGHTVYKNIENEKLKRLHEECLSRFPDSQMGIRIRVNEMMEREEYQDAVDFLGGITESGEWSHRTMAVFNLYASNCYAAIGNRRAQLKYLVLSAEEDCLSGYKQYSSLKLIADQLYLMKEYDKVAEYLKICLDDFKSGAFENRSESGNASLQIMENTIIKVNKRYHIAMFLTVCLALVTITAISYAYYKAVKRKNKMKRLGENLFESNRELKHREMELKNANQIRDKYVFKFMLLSKYYITLIDSHIKRLNRLLKTEGTDAVAKELRRRDITEGPRKDFYETFDKTFLGLFPDFIDRFNSLMPEDERMQVKKNGALTTEMRIFASIKLGITGSREIAEFLDYALTTVYTYRTRIKNKALCGKEEFEKKLCE